MMTQRLKRSCKCWNNNPIFISISAAYDNSVLYNSDVNNGWSSDMSDHFYVLV